MKRIDELKDVKTVAISGHMRPDGDCVCSCLALYHYLKKELPEAKIDVYLEEPPVPFHVLKGIDEIKSEFNRHLTCRKSKQRNMQNSFRRTQSDCMQHCRTGPVS